MPFQPEHQETETIAGVILAGGRARRMGGEDKGLIPLADRPMIEHVLARFRPQVDELLINANRNQDRYGIYGHRVVGDTLADYQGPLAGILTAMASVDRRWLAVVPCDGPLLPMDLVQRLVHAAQSEQADIAVAHDGKRMQPVVALIRCMLQGSLQDFLDQGGRKIDTWYAQHALAIADLSDCPEAFTNVNTPEERATLERAVADAGTS